VIEKVLIKDLATGFYQKGGRSQVLHESLNFVLPPGQMVCILGPNGAGKSTLLRTMLGFRKALAGEVYLGSQTLGALSIKEVSKIVSVVLTEKIDDLYLTAFEIVTTARYPYGTFSGKLSELDKQVIDQAFEKVGIGWLAHHNFHRLSDGEKQKVMIARAIAQDTPFIFLDEPVAFVDSPSKIGIMQLLKELVEDLNKGILMATHDLDSALRYADKLLLLGKNKNWKEGLPDDLIKSGAINEFFDQDQVTFNPENQKFEWTHI
jgi:iron complex transport system ATP-binding protein